MQIDLKELKQVTVLYVEDDEVIRAQTLSVFEKIFKKVYVGKDGHQGINLFNNHQDELDVIVTDLNMPKMTGLELAEEVHKVSKYIPVIFTTAFTDEESLIKAITLNIDSYVTKPLKIQDLTATILKSVKNSKENRNLYKTTKALANEMLSTKKDYGQLKDNCELLEKEVSFYKFLAEHFIASIKLDKFGIIENISNQFSNIYKYSLMDLKNKPINSITPNAANIQKKMLEALKVKEAVGFNEKFITADNEELEFHNILYPLYENKDNYASGYMLYQSLER
ncbi:response regulator [Malaciobacter marinus]|uniref:Signal transduction response regulator n=1 Tax=Malaciobacter marinus TaxID=505249 RepID=A0A347TMV8_9BACT|nr:response regulator [Malaciobacter marinus]AXX87936.1 signal transduction response regulator [Malaciobacter marinus]PHO13238.1 hypothetical protein CPG38_03305 [Malaciobacter marinus]PHO15991.1 hypothetical protein CPH92_03395 [Malaciobacter marinus]